MGECPAGKEKVTRAHARYDMTGHAYYLAEDVRVHCE